MHRFYLFSVKSHKNDLKISNNVLPYVLTSRRSKNRPIYPLNGGGEDAL